MAQKLKSIYIGLDDYERLMIDCSAEFFKAHPDMKYLRINPRFMIKRLIEFYLKY